MNVSWVVDAVVGTIIVLACSFFSTAFSVVGVAGSKEAIVCGGRGAGGLVRSSEATVCGGAEAAGVVCSSEAIV